MEHGDAAPPPEVAPAQRRRGRHGAPAAAAPPPVPGGARPAALADVALPVSMKLANLAAVLALEGLAAAGGEQAEAFFNTAQTVADAAMTLLTVHGSWHDGSGRRSGRRRRARRRRRLNSQAMT
ncbi:hypothetical protein ACP4OV_017045 [Aristida adscensionis]